MRPIDFFRVVKGEITILVLLVAVSGFLSNPGAMNRIVYIVPLMVGGAFASFSSALLNNVYDMDIDGKMHRTRFRANIINPGNRNGFIALAAVFLIISMVVATLLVNPLTALFIFAGFLSYFVLYTIILKRRTTWNIVIGGIAGSFPALAGWAAVSNDISYTALFIALLVFLWTPTHFWSLASYRAEEYKKAGVPMLPAVVGIKRGYSWLVVNTVVLVAFSLLPLLFTEIRVGLIYYVVAVVADIYLLYRVLDIRRQNYDHGFFKKTFLYSNIYLFVLLVSIWFVLI